MKRLANTKQRLAETLTAINEAIQFKQHYPDITFTLYLIAKEYLHNDPVLTPQLNALKGIFQPPQMNMSNHCLTAAQNNLKIAL